MAKRVSIKVIIELSKKLRLKIKRSSMEQRKTIIGWIMVAIVCLIGLGLFFIPNNNAISTQVKGLFTQSQDVEVTPQPTEVPKNNIPTERALKAATYVYYADNGESQEWINKSFPNSLTQSQIDQFKTVSRQQGYSEAEIEAEIKRKQEEEAITKLALWLDVNPNYLVEYEVAINKHQQALQSQYVQQPAQYYAPNNSQIDDIQNQLDQQKRQLQDQVYEQEQQLKEIQREQQNRQLWDTICSGRGQNYNSLAGGGCR